MFCHFSNIETTFSVRIKNYSDIYERSWIELSRGLDRNKNLSGIYKLSKSLKLEETSLLGAGTRVPWVRSCAWLT